MKSEPDDQNKKIQTSCQDCLFAVYDEDTQVGCQHNRLDEAEVLVEAYNERGNFFVVEGLCNLLRHDSWNNGVADKDKALSEISLSFHVIVDAFSLNSLDLKRIDVQYYGDYKVSIVGPPQKQKEILRLRKRLNNCQAHISPFSQYQKHKLVMGEKFSYFIFLDNPKAVSLDLSVFNEKYRIKQTKPIAINFNNVEYVSCLAYNYYSFTKGQLSYEKNMEIVREHAKNNS